MFVCLDKQYRLIYLDCWGVCLSWTDPIQVKFCAEMEMKARGMTRKRWREFLDREPLDLFQVQPSHVDVMTQWTEQLIRSKTPDISNSMFIMMAKLTLSLCITSLRLLHSKSPLGVWHGGRFHCEAAAGMRCVRLDLDWRQWHQHDISMMTHLLCILFKEAELETLVQL